MASNSPKTKTAFIVRTVDGGYEVRHKDGKTEIVDSHRVVRKTIHMVEVMEK